MQPVLPTILHSDAFGEWISMGERLFSSSIRFVKLFGDDMITGWHESLLEVAVG